MSAMLRVLPPGAKRSANESDLEVKCLMDVLRGVAVGQVATYGDLDAAIGRDVRAAAKSVMRRALRHAVHDHGLNFSAVPNEGYQRLDDVGSVRKSEQRRRKQRNQSRWAIEELSQCVDRGALKQEDQAQYDLEMTVHSLVLDQLRPKSLGRLREEIANSKAAIPPAKALEAFVRKTAQK